MRKKNDICTKAKPAAIIQVMGWLCHAD